MEVFNTGTADKPKLFWAGNENAIGVQSDRNLLPITVFLPKKTNASKLNPLAAFK